MIFLWHLLCVCVPSSLTEVQSTHTLSRVATGFPPLPCLYGWGCTFFSTTNPTASRDSSGRVPGGSGGGVQPLSHTWLFETPWTAACQHAPPTCRCDFSSCPKADWQWVLLWGWWRWCLVLMRLPTRNSHRQWQSNNSSNIFWTCACSRHSAFEL